MSRLAWISMITMCVATSAHAQNTGARFAAGYLLENPVQRLVEESLLILGWVANWRPLEIFLYDWWPLARRRDLYRRLAAAAVELRPYAGASLQDQSLAAKGSGRF